MNDDDNMMNIMTSQKLLSLKSPSIPDKCDGQDQIFVHCHALSSTQECALALATSGFAVTLA